MWCEMQFLKNFLGIFTLVTSLTVFADVEKEHVKVNFYTLASLQPELDGKKINIRGWIAFYDYGDRKSVLLFPSKESRNEFNRNESIEIFINEKEFESTKKYLFQKVVSVYGVYSFKPSTHKKLFGEITKVDDIDIIKVD